LIAADLVAKGRSVPRKTKPAKITMLKPTPGLTWRVEDGPPPSLASREEQVEELNKFMGRIFEHDQEDKPYEDEIPEWVNFQYGEADFEELARIDGALLRKVLY
jgi:hypothetical protein